MVAGARGTSRERTARDLLVAHVSEQEERPPEKRLTHVSTVLRFPPPPIHRGGVDDRVRLALRLDEGFAGRACAVSLVLPGQASSRGPREYGPRLLTDAFTTALASNAPYLDEGLEGLPPLLTHRQALGLWRLTVAATLTPAEQRAVFRKENPRAVHALRDEDVAWHSAWRFEVARHMAKNLLRGPAAEANLRMLDEQTTRYNALRHDLERQTEMDHDLLAGLPDLVEEWRGRGGAAVWRAERKVALEDVSAWITNESTCEKFVDVPGWPLAQVKGWVVHRFPRGQPLAPLKEAHVARGLVLRVDDRGHSGLWPYTSAGDTVPGFDAVLRGGAHLRPEELVELVLLEDFLGPPEVPAGIAHELRFITAWERDDLLARAERNNQSERRSVLDRALLRGVIDKYERDAALHDEQYFLRLVRRERLRCHLQRPTWTWQVDSIPAALADGQRPDRVQWLTRALGERRDRWLERSMQDASREAYWLGGTAVPDDLTDLEA